MVNLVMTKATYVMIAVTVLTWVLRDFASIVVQIFIAGEKAPIVWLVISVATHGQCMEFLLIVTNFPRESWLA